ncbi:MAG: XdhC/CoxI family protein [Treponema sp.]|jgi:xanthine dehydrogenase accessory factor|nr:XdhC/CoxI family protein [Treponema sp.]
MKKLFFAMRDLFTRGESFALVTVVGASGSTPRGPGARMLVGREGRLWGTIGGALPEHLAIGDARSLVGRGGGSCLKNYILRENEAADIGAKCGGEISVYSLFVDARDSRLLPFVEKALECFSEKKASWFIMSLDSGVSFCLAREDGAAAVLGDAPSGLSLLLGNQCVRLEQNGLSWFSQPLASAGFVYVFGGGHVAQELVPLLCRLDFRCLVFDDREEFTQRELFPDAEGIIRGDFKRIGDSLSLGREDYAVIVTRGHLWDFEAEAFALKSEAPYIGVIGSRTKQAFVREKLLEAGFNAKDLNAPRVHAPIGIDIGSKTPAEVAVSIAAELVRTRSELLRSTVRG